MRLHEQYSKPQLSYRVALFFLIVALHFLLFLQLIFGRQQTDHAKHFPPEHIVELKLLSGARVSEALKRIPPQAKKESQKHASTYSSKRSMKSTLTIDVSQRTADSENSMPSISTDTQALPPTFDLGQLRAQVLKNERIRDRTPEEIYREKQIVVSNVTTKFEEGAKRAQKKDCRTAYAGVGLLAIIPLVVSTATDTGCKW